MRSLILDHIARGILLVLFLFAVFFLLRGHNEPGGGFIAGLVTSVGIILQALAFGAARTRKMLARKLRPAAWIGVVVAVAAGLPGAVLGDGFLKHYHAHLDIPGGRPLHLSTTLLFDAGVYLVVVGVTATLLSTFASTFASTSPLARKP